MSLKCEVILKGLASIYFQLTVSYRWETCFLCLDLILDIVELLFQGEEVIEVLVHLSFEGDHAEELITEVDKPLCSICAVHDTILVVNLLSSLSFKVFLLCL